MSGGRLSKTEDGGGGSPVLHEESKAKKGRMGRTPYSPAEKRRAWSWQRWGH